MGDGKGEYQLNHKKGTLRFALELGLTVVGAPSLSPLFPEKVTASQH